MDYEIKQLSNELIYICWHRSPTPTSDSESKFVADLQKILDESSNVLYFLSDLRHGRIINVLTLQRLAELVTHINWGGSTAFSNKSTTADFVRTFAVLTKQNVPQDEHHDTPEAAIAYLETLKPGITQGIDWTAIIDA